jgi:hypothetical protein
VLIVKNWSKNVAKAAKKTEAPKTDTASFVENMSKKGTDPNGTRINFGFTRRKRKSSM